LAAAGAVELFTAPVSWRIGTPAFAADRATDFSDKFTSRNTR